ncbi:TPA: hypothetical protein ACGTP8_000248 [Yersinia enterocolitica]
MDKHIEELDRQEFETWFISLFHPHHMNRNKSGSYYFIDANVAWTAWQERGKALLAKLEAAEECKKSIFLKYEKMSIAYSSLAEVLTAAEKERDSLAVQLEIATERAGINFDRAEAAEARLLVPVKLPDGTGWCSDPYNHGRNDGIRECKDSLKADGFKVEGE